MSDPDALTTVPMARSAPTEPSDFLADLRAYAERSALALQLLGRERT